jgi:integrase
MLRNHILPPLGQTELNRLTPSVVRRWHSDLARAERLAVSTVAKCYRLLHAILETAVADELIVKNPCLVRGAAQDRSAERPIATLAEVLSLAEAVDPRYRALVLTATMTGLRLGELLALRRGDVDLLRRTVSVERQLYELSDGTQHVGPPKTAAGHRVVAIPPPLIAELEQHLEAWSGPEGQSFVFTSPDGRPIRRNNFRARVWLPAVRAIGLEQLRFHDLRHTGNTLAAATGASTRELMARMGHASPRAALIYQHATSERDQAIAAALGVMLANAAPTTSAPVRSIRHASD